MTAPAERPLRRPAAWAATAPWWGHGRNRGAELSESPYRVTSGLLAAGDQAWLARIPEERIRA